MFRLEKAGVSVSFGIPRAVGSLAYSAFVAMLGSLIEKFGIGVMPISTEITCALMIASLMFVGYYFKKAMSKVSEQPEHKKQEEKINLAQFIKRNKMFF